MNDLEALWTLLVILWVVGSFIVQGVRKLLGQRPAPLPASEEITERRDADWAAVLQRLGLEEIFAETPEEETGSVDAGVNETVVEAFEESEDVEEARDPSVIPLRRPAVPRTPVAPHRPTAFHIVRQGMLLNAVLGAPRSFGGRP